MAKRLSPAGVALLYAAFAALWIIASGSLLTFTVSDHDLQSRIEIAKGMLFVAITGGLLYLLLKNWQQPAGKSMVAEFAEDSIQKPVRLFLLFTALALIAPVIGVAVLQLHGPQIERETYVNLESVARLKSGQIENWLAERQGDAKYLAANEGFAEQVNQLRQRPDARLQTAILSSLGALKDTHGYHGILLLDAGGRRMLLLGDQDDMSPALQQQMRQALASNTVQRGNLYRDASGNVHLDWVVPIVIHDGHGSHAIATAVLRTTAQHFLFPLIQTWPSSSPSAETLLVRRDGETAVFLNDLRHRKDTALLLRFPLNQPDLPAAMAIRANQAGTTEGRDHRNKPVLAAYRPVAGTDWFIVAKIDRAEVMAPLQEMVFWISFIAFAAVIALSVAILLLLHQQRGMRDLLVRAHDLEAAQTLKISDDNLHQSLERIQALVDTALDAMISMDQDGNVIAWNPQAEVIFGYAADHAIGRELALLIVPPAQREEHRQGMARFMRTGTPTIIGKRIEIAAMRADGTEFPVELTISTRMQNGQHRFNAYVRDITERKTAEAAIYDLAFYDPLTHLPNRRLMLDRLKQTLLSGTRMKRYGAILFVDLDDFKTLNDSRGREVGDLLLKQIAQLLQATVHGDDSVARKGNDEYVVMLEALGEIPDQVAVQAKAVAERILAAINLPHDLAGFEFHCTASIGIALFLGTEISGEMLLENAAAAMHQAKKDGRNSVCFFDQAAQAALESRVLLESWMRKAVPDEFRLYYQMQVDNAAFIHCAEVLIRWQHPDKGMIYPGNFIPLAEETGLILPIGLWVLETACAQLKTWEHDPAARHLTLAVNVSARQFHQPDFVAQVLAVLGKTGADPNKLKLELTESMLVDDVEDIIGKMTALKAHGVKFSLDDFGTGFSSLSYLRRLPLNQLKIDQSFVRDALTSPNDAAIIRTVIALGQSLGLEVIAEGVETEEHRNFLAVHGCQHYQGYLFSRPVPLADFEQLLRRVN